MLIVGENPRPCSRQVKSGEEEPVLSFLFFSSLDLADRMDAYKTIMKSIAGNPKLRQPRVFFHSGS
jgi:hypothetical protein